MRPRRTWLLVLTLVLPACTSSFTPPQAPPPDASEALKELGEVYKYRASQQLSVPTKLEDLAEQQAVLGNAWPLVESGGIVVVWRAGYSPSSTDVLAYEKDAPTNGGNVLLRNGNVKNVTAAEFKVAKR